tara:strand:+ start:262 stop:723 length:462 start_codon:yes stop_codon:yes gene_type:complete
MYFISHRGNLIGPNKKDENKIDYINEALKQNFNVEIDLWFDKNKFYLGHDEPLYEVSTNFLANKNFWIHAKNLDCFYQLSNYNFNYFWHEQDKVILTSRGFFWNFPGTKLNKKKSIYVLPELSEEFDTSLNYTGICSDYIIKYKNEIEAILKK